jgi:hypothetical protein
MTNELPGVGSPITIALKWSNSMKNGERLVRTYVSHHSHLYPINEKAFCANDDDHPEHHLSNYGVTWLPGHISFDSPEAKILTRWAEYAERKPDYLPICNEDFCEECGDCLGCNANEKCYGPNSQGGSHCWPPAADRPSFSSAKDLPSPSENADKQTPQEGSR